MNFEEIAAAADTQSEEAVRDSRTEEAEVDVEHAEPEDAETDTQVEMEDAAEAGSDDEDEVIDDYHGVPRYLFLDC